MEMEEINKEELKQSVKDWLLKIDETEKIPSDIVALCFNLYEVPYAMEVVGAKWFDKNDGDWACEEDFVQANREELFQLKIPENVKWKKALKILVEIFKELYVELKDLQIFKVQHIAVGFVDGDLKLIK